jgi:ABC-type transport system involved in multi-copper enzyme maturation permease subunit
MRVIEESGATTSTPAPAPAPVRPARTTRLDSVSLKVTQWRVIRSEWIKLRSVRSWLVMIGAAVVVVVGMGALAAAVASGSVSAPTPPGGGGAAGGRNPFAATDPTALSLAGVTLAQLIVGVLGVLLVSNEYANGSIRNWFGAVPRRLPVLWGKAVVLTVVLSVVMVLACLAAFLLGQSILGGDKGTTLAADGVLRAVIGSGLYLAGIGLFGIAIGSLMRNTAGAIAVVVASLLIIPGLIGLILPDSVNQNVSPYLPSTAGQAFTTVQPADTLLASGTGAAVFVGWLVVLLAGAAVLLRHRDA